MIVLYFAFLIFNFAYILTQDAPGGASSPVVSQTPTGVQAANAGNNGVVTTVAPSTPVTQPNLEVRTPGVSPITSSAVNTTPTAASVAIDSSAPTTEVPNTIKNKPTQEVVTPETPASSAPGQTQPVDLATGISIQPQVDATINTPSVTPVETVSPVETISPEVNVVGAAPQDTTAALTPPEVSVVQAPIPVPPANDVATSVTPVAIPTKIEEKPAAKKEREAVMSNINTLDVEEEGNWLLKRVWWEQAEQTFEKIISLNDDVIKLQIDYISKRSELDKKLSDLFRKLGFEQGEISQVLEYFLHQLSLEREAHGLEAPAREFLDILGHKKEDIEKVQTDLNSLSELDISVDNVINQLVDQVNKSRDYEKSAWQDFKEIGRVLNDKKAKTLFYQIEADLKSIQNIQIYLSADLKKYYQDLLDNVDKLSNSIVTKVNDLEKETGNLKEQFEKLQREEELRKQNELENKLKGESQSKQAMPKKQKSWLATMWDKVTSIF
ncbi:MAG: hypothetical protein P4L22_02380 [Candidatus Babeliales bacterium]|nr:hypothetical protein [Candidatus Babeliales bacterium]